MGTVDGTFDDGWQQQVVSMVEDYRWEVVEMVEFERQVICILGPILGMRLSDGDKREVWEIIRPVGEWYEGMSGRSFVFDRFRERLGLLA